MRILSKKTALIMGVLSALTLPLSAALIRLDAVLTAEQETTTSNSDATGTATLWYDTSANTFSLDVSVDSLTNAVTGSHLHEAPAGMSGGVVTGIGDENAYTRDGDMLTANFTAMPYGGDPATLLSGGTYLNIHSAEYPDGEIRGQFTASPIKLWAHLTPGQETGLVNSDAYGTAEMWFNPNTSKFHLTVFNYNFTNTLVGSHIHEAAAGVDGAVVNSLGSGAEYNQNGNTYSQMWSDVDYEGDLTALLDGGAYINVHSDEYATGEIRGQLWVSNPDSGSAIANVSSRGMVGNGDAALVVGFVIEGTEPVPVVVTGRGPVLTDYGVNGALADPVIYVHDIWGNQIAWNDDKADASYMDTIADTGFMPTMDAEAAVYLLLPPGPHTMTVKGVDDTTGIAIAEAFDARN